ncbi:uncharacterized protein [Triticum aestivum]|uniref:uncharacterized protein n=1 Tax=Triticum aestivum TaxID=4565 RepID=UPI001D01768D|nr:uncharacterized protein LOC123129802 [Triticum aestivum]
MAAPLGFLCFGWATVPVVIAAACGMAYFFGGMAATRRRAGGGFGGRKGGNGGRKGRARGRARASFNTTFTVDVDGGDSDAASFVVLLDSFPSVNIGNEKYGPRRNTSNSVVLAASMPNATNGLANVEVGSVSSYGPRPPPGVGLNITITPNRSSPADTSQLAVRIEYDAPTHRLSVYAHDTAADYPPVNDRTTLLLDAPLDLADCLPAKAAPVGFYDSTVPRRHPAGAATSGPVRGSGCVGARRRALPAEPGGGRQVQLLRVGSTPGPPC